MKFRYNRAILGGTFDRLHIGHKELINKTLKESESVIIGIATPKLIKNKFLSETIENYSIRKNNLKEFLQERGFLERVSLISLNNIFGNSLKGKNIDAIFVTRQTYENAILINKKRKEINLNPLKINIVPLLKGEDGKIITSERIRSGEIDENGKSYYRVFENKKKLILPSQLKKKMREPFGEVLKNVREIKDLNQQFLIAVGDVISINLRKVNIKPKINIIDFRAERKNLDRKLVSKVINKNPAYLTNTAGTINTKAFKVFSSTLDKYFKTRNNQTIIIKGEEDLLALVAIILAPLEFVVLYGLSNVGINSVKIDQNKKREATQILSKFDYE